jgi:hypothetical protein
MKAKDIEIYLKFIMQYRNSSGESVSSSYPTSIPSNPKIRNSNMILAASAESNNTTKGLTSTTTPPKFLSSEVASSPEIIQPKELVTADDDHAVEQINECEALQVIYPDEYKQISVVRIDSLSGEKVYTFPIEYKVLLVHENLRSLCPSDIALRVRYPAEYPDVSAIFSLDHTMNSMQFPSNLERNCLGAVREVSAKEIGMPCAMSCILAANDFFENHDNIEQLPTSTGVAEGKQNKNDEQRNVDGITNTSNSNEAICCDERLILGIPANSKVIETCDDEGQQIANEILRSSLSSFNMVSSSLGQQGQAYSSSTVGNFTASNGSGGVWKYTIGLVGKPSAGKSTFFNAATAFARQPRDDDAFTTTFGASMAPHPFTTIDPNVGFCFVPALPGSCPEDLLSSREEKFAIGSTHGRDSHGRRLIPVTLKDVAGLVPGAYTGRGRGNKVRL